MPKVKQENNTIPETSVDDFNHTFYTDTYSLLPKEYINLIEPNDQDLQTRNIHILELFSNERTLNGRAIELLQIYHGSDFATTSPCLNHTRNSEPLFIDGLQVPKRPVWNYQTPLDSKNLEKIYRKQLNRVREACCGNFMMWEQLLVCTGNAKPERKYGHFVNIPGIYYPNCRQLYTHWKKKDMMYIKDATNAVWDSKSKIPETPVNTAAIGQFFFEAVESYSFHQPKNVRGGAKRSRDRTSTNYAVFYKTEFFNLLKEYLQDFTIPENVSTLVSIIKHFRQFTKFKFDTKTTQSKYCLGDIRNQLTCPSMSRTHSSKVKYQSWYGDKYDWRGYFSKVTGLHETFSENLSNRDKQAWRMAVKTAFNNSVQTERLFNVGKFYENVAICDEEVLNIRKTEIMCQNEIGKTSVLQKLERLHTFYPDPGGKQNGLTDNKCYKYDEIPVLNKINHHIDIRGHQFSVRRDWAEMADKLIKTRRFEDLYHKLNYFFLDPDVNFTQLFRIITGSLNHLLKLDPEQFQEFCSFLALPGHEYRESTGFIRATEPLRHTAIQEQVARYVEQSKISDAIEIIKNEFKAKYWRTEEYLDCEKSAIRTVFVPTIHRTRAMWKPIHLAQVACLCFLQHRQLEDWTGMGDKAYQDAVAYFQELRKSWTDATEPTPCRFDRDSPKSKMPVQQGMAYGEIQPEFNFLQILMPYCCTFLEITEHNPLATSKIRVKHVKEIFDTEQARNDIGFLSVYLTMVEEYFPMARHNFKEDKKDREVLKVLEEMITVFPGDTGVCVRILRRLKKQVKRFDAANFLTRSDESDREIIFDKMRRLILKNIEYGHDRMTNSEAGKLAGYLDFVNARCGHTAGYLEYLKVFKQTLRAEAFGRSDGIDNRD